MFYFTRNDWRWNSRCQEVQDEHYRRLAKYASEEYSNITLKGCHEVDTLTWSVNYTSAYYSQNSL